MINADSRYVTARIRTNIGPDGETRQEMRPAFPRSRRISYTYYRVTEGERVDIIARDFFAGRSDLWWMIADANPEIFDWFNLEPGTVIRVPNA